MQAKTTYSSDFPFSYSWLKAELHVKKNRKGYPEYTPHKCWLDPCFGEAGRTAISLMLSSAQEEKYAPGSGAFNSFHDFKDTFINFLGFVSLLPSFLYVNCTLTDLFHFSGQLPKDVMLSLPLAHHRAIIAGRRPQQQRDSA